MEFPCSYLPIVKAILRLQQGGREGLSAMDWEGESAVSGRDESISLKSMEPSAALKRRS